MDEGAAARSKRPALSDCHVGARPADVPWGCGRRTRIRPISENEHVEEAYPVPASPGPTLVRSVADDEPRSVRRSDAKIRSTYPSSDIFFVKCWALYEGMAQATTSSSSASSGTRLTTIFRWHDDTSFRADCSSRSEHSTRRVWQPARAGSQGWAELATARCRRSSKRSNGRTRRPPRFVCSPSITTSPSPRTCFPHPSSTAASAWPAMAGAFCARQPGTVFILLSTATATRLSSVGSTVYAELDTGHDGRDLGPVSILGAGSAGSSSVRDGANFFNVLAVHSDRIELEIYRSRLRENAREEFESLASWRAELELVRGRLRLGRWMAPKVYSGEGKKPGPVLSRSGDRGG